VGTVLKLEGTPEIDKVTTYVKPDHFFALPMNAVDGVVMVDGKRLMGEGKAIKSPKYKNGPIG